jgi:hypothetical protein
VREAKKAVCVSGCGLRRGYSRAVRAKYASNVTLCCFDRSTIFLEDGNPNGKIKDTRESNNVLVAVMSCVRENAIDPLGVFRGHINS